MAQRKTGVITTIALYGLCGVALAAALIVGLSALSLWLSALLEGHETLELLWRALTYAFVVASCVAVSLVVLVVIWLFLAYKQCACAQPKSAWVPPPAANRARSCARLR